MLLPYQIRKLEPLNRQLYYSITGEFEKSDQILINILKERPWDIRAQYNLAFKLLREGNIRDGMELLNRGRLIGIFGSPPLNINKPIYHPSRNNETILVNLEGGMGDGIIGMKFAREISKKNKVIGLVPKPLKSLAEKQPYFSSVYTRLEDAISSHHDIDSWVPSLAFEHIMGYTVYDQLPRDPHIFLPTNKSKENKKSKKHSRSKNLPSIRVGVKFCGNREFDHDIFRSPKVGQILEALDSFRDKFQFFSLEVEDNIGSKLPKWVKRTEKGDWLYTAKKISSYSFVISTCTGVAHLSAGMGKLTFIFVPVLPFWLWAYPRVINNLDRSWYYDSAVLLRQTNFDDWSNPLQKLHNMLSELSKKLDEYDVVDEFGDVNINLFDRKFSEK